VILPVPVPFPPLPAVPPMWREYRVPLEWAALQRSDVIRGEALPDGEGRGVLLVPGFLAGDGSLATMTHWLRAAGWRTKSAGIRANVNCSATACARIEERLEALAAATGDRVVVIGQSRGGIFARALGAGRPDLVAGVVTLGSPMRSQLAVHPFVLAQIGMLGLVGAVAGGHALSWRCLRGECCERFRAALRAPFPPEVGFVALYSRSDGVVDWRACLDPDAECVEVDASHIGMSLNAEAYEAVARALAGFAATAREPGRRAA
jgi:pimeloyl-ACP methyl ester carboxylesterase